MGIYLGDLRVNQIEKRLGIEFTKHDKKTLEDAYQAKVNNTPIEHGKWHCFDLPFMLMTHDKETVEKFLAIFKTYNPSTFKECFRIAWEGTWTS